MEFQEKMLLRFTDKPLIYLVLPLPISYIFIDETIKTIYRATFM